MSRYSTRLASARRGDDQKRWLYIAGAGGLVLGLLLYAVLAGPIVRMTPDSWQWPEGVATRVPGESDPWEAGQRLMRSASPDVWHGIVQASHLAKDNRDMFQACQRAAAKAKKAVHCTIEVKADE